MIDHENLPQSSDQLDVLRQAREQNATNAAERALGVTLINADYTQNLSSFYNRLNNSFICSDHGQLSVHDLMAFEALGVSEDAITTEGELAEESLSITEGNEELLLEKYSSGFRGRLKIDGEFSPNPEDKQSSQVIADKVRERYKGNPTFTAIHKALEEWQVSEEKPLAIQTDIFDLGSDRLGTLAALQVLDLLNHPNAKEAKRLLAETRGMSVGEFLEQAVALKSYRHERVENNDGTITIGPRAEYRERMSQFFTYDPKTGVGHVRWMQNPDYFYQERANQSDQAGAIPFVETECAAQLFDSLTQAGLTIAPKIREEMVRVEANDNRYGSVYTEISRTIAKWVNDPKRTDVTRLFRLLDETAGLPLSDHKVAMAELQRRYSPADSDLEVTEIVEKIRFIDTSELSPPAAYIINMAQQALSRSEDDIAASDLEVGNEDISMRGGACFDVALYYIGASSRPGHLGLVDVSQVTLLEKRNDGAHTFLTTHPINFNGVGLPKGALLAKSDKGAWSFLRLTPFAFDNPADQLATGAEMAKAVRQYEHIVKFIGGTSVDDLVRYTKRR